VEKVKHEFVMEAPRAAI